MWKPTFSWLLLVLMFLIMLENCISQYTDPKPALRLQNLNLLTGTIPSELGKLTNLEMLELDGGYNDEQRVHSDDPNKDYYGAPGTHYGVTKTIYFKHTYLTFEHNTNQWDARTN